MVKRLILASGSPRRKELLKRAGVSFRVFHPNVNEDLLPKESPQSMVRRLAEEKALAVLKRFGSNSAEKVILAADTTVLNSSGEVLGKPSSKGQAFKMIQSLQGKDHYVFTGYAIIRGTPEKILQQIQRVVKTRVRIRSMSRDEIRAYIDLGESYDKAGGYAAQGFGMAIIENIHGSYTNVVGLPMAQVLSDLRKIGWNS